MRFFGIAVLAASAAIPGFCQKFSPENLGPSIPTPEPVVQRMLDLARVKAADTVYDLGSGDGRVVIMAVQKYGARAVGVAAPSVRQRTGCWGVSSPLSRTALGFRSSA